MVTLTPHCHPFFCLGMSLIPIMPSFLLCQKIEDSRDVIEGKEVITVHQWPCDSIQAAIGGYRDIWNLHFCVAFAVVMVC